MTNTFNQVEILAPCGSYEILIAAVKAGADACYIGGNKFGARAYATNLAEDSIISAIDYAHLHDVKLYLTVNTLLKNNEIKELYNYISPYYEAGIDAIIVQDLGVFDYIRQTFPNLPIHCSTQMNINSVHSAAMMKKLGATRVVTAREMPLDEIKAIKDEVDIEIESFVHGAMCYSYSGQCLMSSLAGGRSGNRGRCAQPCRKCYDNQYILSMKDMCTLEHIPSLVEAGIDSLKIEGRMKNEYYVASSVAAYKELLTDYYEGNFNKDKAIKLKNRLAAIYNRGGFCDSYYFTHNGPQMISKDRPNNQGVYMGKLGKILPGKISFKLEEDMFKQDVLEIVLKGNETMDITSGISGKKGDTITLNAPKTKEIIPNQHIYRTRCNHLIQDITDTILSPNMNLPLEGVFTACVGEKMCLELKLFGKTIKVYSDNIVEQSENKPANEEDIKSKLSMMGNTDYKFKSLQVNLSSNAFIAMSQLKALRREGINVLEETITDNYRRKRVPELKVTDVTESAGSPSHEVCSVLPIYAEVTNLSQLKEILSYNIAGIYIQRSLYDDIIESGVIIPDNLKIYIELPYIIKKDFDLNDYLPDRFDGIYIRNIDGYAAYLSNIDKLRAKRIVLGAGLYAYNDVSRSFFYDENITFEIPKELNLKEIDTLIPVCSELTVYEYQQVMLSAQCVIKNTSGCNHNNRIKKITDDKGNSFYARANCKECCNIIYNGIPTSLLDKLDDSLIRITNASSLRFNFTIETGDEVRKVLNYYVNRDNSLGSITTGHYYRGVE